MATRGNIGLRKKDGSLIAVYNHFDSYPSKLLVDVSKYLAAHSIEEFEALLRKGGKEQGFSYFPETYNDDDDDWLITDDEEIKTQSHVYIFNEDKELVEVYKYGKEQDLEDFKEYVNVKEQIDTPTSSFKNCIFVGSVAENLLEGENVYIIGLNSSKDLVKESNITIIGDNIDNVTDQDNPNLLMLFPGKLAIGKTLFGKPIGDSFTSLAEVLRQEVEEQLKK
jgi:hypothetical protein